MSVSNDQIYQALLNIKEDVGEIRILAEKNDEHILHVSRKADAIRNELDAHRQDGNAHGAGGERRASKSLIAWITVIVIIINMLSNFGGSILKAVAR